MVHVAHDRDDGRAGLEFGRVFLFVDRFGFADERDDFDIKPKGIGGQGGDIGVDLLIDGHHRA